MELSIGHVKPATLELNVKRGERLHSDQVMDDAGGIAVVLAVMEGLDGTSGILKVLVPKNKGKFPTFNSKQRMTNQNSYNKIDEKKEKVIPIAPKNKGTPPPPRSTLNNAWLTKLL